MLLISITIPVHTVQFCHVYCSMYILVSCLLSIVVGGRLVKTTSVAGAFFKSCKIWSAVGG